MKRTADRTRKVPVAWSDVDYPEMRAGFADTLDDRIPEVFVDYDDEREVIEVLAQRMIRTLN